MDRALAALKGIAIIIGIAVAFSVGLLGAVVLSLHSSETTVPDVVGQDPVTAENTISRAGLNFHVRATRPVSDAKPNTVLIQIPGPGVIVKVGQTVAVDVSLPASPGENPPPAEAKNASPEAKINDASTNESNLNENKPKRTRNTNKNANDNGNANSNRKRVLNANSNANANGAISKPENARPAATPANKRANEGSAENVNHGAGNSNANRRPRAAVPAPTP